MITLYAFKWVPDFAQGLVRDLRVRWALEEAGIPYGTKLLGQDDKDAPAYRILISRTTSFSSFCKESCQPR